MEKTSFLCDDLQYHLLKKENLQKALSEAMAYQMDCDTLVYLQHEIFQTRIIIKNILKEIEKENNNNTNIFTNEENN